MTGTIGESEGIMFELSTRALRMAMAERTDNRLSWRSKRAVSAWEIPREDMEAAMG